jgi:hypothetical protein
MNGSQYETTDDGLRRKGWSGIELLLVENSARQTPQVAERKEHHS